MTQDKRAWIIDNVVRYGVAYQNPSEAADAEQHRRRIKKNLRHCAKQLRCELHKIAAPPPPEAEATPSPA